MREDARLMFYMDPKSRLRRAQRTNTDNLTMGKHTSGEINTGGTHCMQEDRTLNFKNKIGSRNSTRNERHIP